MFAEDWPKCENKPLAEIVREMTDDGRLIVRFLVDTMEGKDDDVMPCQRLDASDQLLDLGGHQDLVEFARGETDDGRLIVCLLLDIVQRKIDGVSERDRVKARRLLNRVFSGETWIPLTVHSEE